MEESMIEMLGFLAMPLGYAMKWMYDIVGSYGWTIIIFTFLVRLAMLPLTTYEQKSRAKMSAYQPMMDEIRKKWGNDKNKQNEEIMKFQQENGIKMTGGCLPVIANMIVLFSVIAVIQAPLNYMLQVPVQQIENGVAIVEHFNPESDINAKPFTRESILIGEIEKDPQMFRDGYDDVQMDEESVDKVNGFDFKFMNLNLSVIPELGLNPYIILPILSVLAQIASQVIIMKTSGASAMPGNSMWMMTIGTSLFFGWYAFTVPVGFSLYYTASSVVMTLMQLVVRKIHNPEKIKEQIMAEIEERKKAKKAKKKVTIQDEKGNVVQKDLSEAELIKLRLAKARELDAQRYGDSEEDEEKAEKARKQDEEKYEMKKPAVEENNSDEAEEEMQEEETSD